MKLQQKNLSKISFIVIGIQIIIVFKEHHNDALFFIYKMLSHLINEVEIFFNFKIYLITLKQKTSTFNINF